MARQEGRQGGRAGTSQTTHTYRPLFPQASRPRRSIFVPPRIQALRANRDATPPPATEKDSKEAQPFSAAVGNTPATIPTTNPNVHIGASTSFSSAGSGSGVPVHVGDASNSSPKAPGEPAGAAVLNVALAPVGGDGQAALPGSASSHASPVQVQVATPASPPAHIPTIPVPEPLATPTTETDATRPTTADPNPDGAASAGLGSGGPSPTSPLATPLLPHAPLPGAKINQPSLPSHTSPAALKPDPAIDTVVSAGPEKVALENPNQIGAVTGGVPADHAEAESRAEGGQAGGALVEEGTRLPQPESSPSGEGVERLANLPSTGPMALAAGAESRGSHVVHTVCYVGSCRCLTKLYVACMSVSVCE